MRTILTEAEFKVLSEFSKSGSLTQRELARRLNLGLGTINYVLKSLIRKGYVKVKHLREPNSKRKCIYILTPKWMLERTGLTKHFIEKKVVEYNRLKEEIEALENMLSEAELQECGGKKKETNGTRI